MSSWLRSEGVKKDKEFFLDLALPHTKLEVMRRRTMRLLIVVLLLLAAFTLIVSLVTVILGGRSLLENKSLFNPEAVVFTQGLVHTISCGCLLFLIAAFPQRVFLRLSRKGSILPQQIIVIILLLCMVLLPSFGLPGVVSFWQAYSGYRDAVEGRDFRDQYGYLIASNSVITNNESTLSVLVLVLWFWATLLNVSAYYSSGIADRLAKFEVEKEKAHRKARKDRVEVVMFSSVDLMSKVSGKGRMEQPNTDDDDLSQDLESQEDPAYDAEEQLETGGAKAIKRKGAGLQAMHRYRVCTFTERCTTSLATNIRDLIHWGKERSVQIGFCSCYYFCCWCMCCDFQRCASKTSVRGVLRRGLAWRFLVWLFFYLAVYSAVAEEFLFSPSVIPFVGIITVIRVCAGKDSDGFSYCSPDAYPVPFRRAMWSTALFLMDVVTFFFLGRYGTKALRALERVPYSLNRSNFLGFLWVQSTSGFTWMLVLFVSFLEVSIAALELSLYQPQLPSNSTSVDDLEYVLNPLWQVGISSEGLNFASVGLCLSVWTLLITYAYLPADSNGFKGWFVPAKHGMQSAQEPDSSGENSTAKRTASNNTNATSRTQLVREMSMTDTMLDEYFAENPLIVTHEARFSSMFKSAQENHGANNMLLRLGSQRVMGLASQGETMREEPAALAVEVAQLRHHDRTFGALRIAASHEHDLARAALMDLEQGTPAEVVERRKRVMQLLHSHVLVLEADVLMFNFAAVTYKVSSASKVMTPAEEQELVQESGFTIERHIVHEETDTHVIVASSEDRVVVAFRGTVTSKNVDTDLDLSWAVWEDAADVEPMALDKGPMENRARSKDPEIHQGFLKAYRLVQDEIWSLVEPLVLCEGVQYRAIFCTGHSLGGGLAVVCAFDLGMALRKKTGVMTPSVGCTTFGCPRVGSYSFAQRFQRLVPATHRVVLANDLIAKTPPRVFKGPYNGYHHVGLEILLDLQGNMIVTPNIMERAMFHGFRRVQSKMHFCSRYALALVLLSARMRFEPDLWVVHLNSMLHFARSDIVDRDPALLAEAHGIFMKEGVVVTHQNKAYRTFGVQVDSSEMEMLVSASVGEQEQGQLVDGEDDLEVVVAAVNRLVEAKEKLRPGQRDVLLALLDELSSTTTQTTDDE